MLMLNIPATVGLMLLAPPIVKLIFERGAFTAADTAATAAAVQFYALGLIGYSVVRICSPVFYALGQNRTPVIVSGITVLANAALNVALVGVMGYRGLALGTSIAALFNAGLLLFLLRRRLRGIEGRRVLGSLARIALASIAMGVVAAVVDAEAARLLPGSGLTVQVVRLAATIGAAMAVLAGSAYVLRVREFREAIAVLGRRRRVA
jgi:putative peptidoglycan lipid II flippase